MYEDLAPSLASSALATQVRPDAGLGFVVLPPIEPPTVPHADFVANQQSSISRVAVSDTASARSLPSSQSSSVTATASTTPTSSAGEALPQSKVKIVGSVLPPPPDTHITPIKALWSSAAPVGDIGSSKQPLVDPSLAVGELNSSLINEPSHIGKRARSAEPRAPANTLSSLHGDHTRGPKQARSCSPGDLRTSQRTHSSSLNATPNSSTTTTSSVSISSLAAALEKEVSQPPVAYASPMAAAPQFGTTMMMANAQSNGSMEPAADLSTSPDIEALYQQMLMEKMQEQLLIQQLINSGVPLAYIIPPDSYDDSMGANTASFTPEQYADAIANLAQAPPLEAPNSSTSPNVSASSSSAVVSPPRIKLPSIENTMSALVPTIAVTPQSSPAAQNSLASSSSPSLGNTQSSETTAGSQFGTDQSSLCASSSLSTSQTTPFPPTHVTSPWEVATTGIAQRGLTPTFAQISDVLRLIKEDDPTSSLQFPMYPHMPSLMANVPCAQPVPLSDGGGQFFSTTLVNPIAPLGSTTRTSAPGGDSQMQPEKCVFSTPTKAESSSSTFKAAEDALKLAQYQAVLARQLDKLKRGDTTLPSALPGLRSYSTPEMPGNPLIEVKRRNLLGMTPPKKSMRKGSPSSGKRKRSRSKKSQASKRLAPMQSLKKSTESPARVTRFSPPGAASKRLAPMQSLKKSPESPARATSGYLHDAAKLLGATISDMTRTAVAPAIASVLPTLTPNKENSENTTTADMTIVKEEATDDASQPPSMKCENALKTETPDNKTEKTEKSEASCMKSSGAADSVATEATAENDVASETKQSASSPKGRGMLGWYPQNDVVISHQPYSIY